MFFLFGIKINDYFCFFTRTKNTLGLGIEPMTSWFFSVLIGYGPSFRKKTCDLNEKNFGHYGATSQVWKNEQKHTLFKSDDFCSTSQLLGDRAQLMIKHQRVSELRRVKKRGQQEQINKCLSVRWYMLFFEI
jgi:hypothetical protein